MRRFRFSLERVLRYRGRQVQLAQAQLAAARAKEAAAAAALEAAQAERLSQVAAITAQEQAGTTADSFALQRGYLHGLRQQELAMAQQLSQAAAETARRLDQLVGRRKAERMIEKLRERQLAQYQLESQRAEQADLDELGKRPGGPGKEADPWQL